jgi:glutaredoxin
VEQRCPLVNVWLTWIGLPLLAVVVGWRAGWIAGVVLLAVAIPFQALAVRWFPKFAGLLGYGSMADVAAGDVTPPMPAATRVTFYTASVCPFCPIVRRRLVALQQQLGFAIEEIDVTFRPDLVRAKGLKSVPVVEANGQVLVGNATSQQLVAFLTQQPAPRA